MSLSRGEFSLYSGQVYTPILKCPRISPGRFLAAIALLSLLSLRLAAAQTPRLSQPIFPLSQVHRGELGIAYTVFEGSKPEAIHLEILGVLRDAIGPGKDMILARLTGAKPEYMGVVAGMSGSPVYIDGKLAGAIGYRIGEFTKQPIAGITPIQQMLEVFDTNYSSRNNSISSIPISQPSSQAVSAWSGESANALQPIETPLVFNGFSPAAIDLFKRHVPGLGLTPVSGLGGASPDQTDTAPVVPGSAISAIIVSGDFNMAATCTVTYVDPKRLLACGHPITRFGDISLPMSKAVVVTTIASPLDPIKVIQTTRIVGAFTEDRASGVVGVFGKTARMIPVTLTIRGLAPPHTYHFSIVDHARLTSGALIATLYQAMQDTNGYEDPSTYALTGDIALDGYPAVKIDEWIAPAAGQTSNLAAVTTISRRFDSIFQNPRDLPDIRSISFTLDTLAGRRTARLAEAHVPDATVHAGDRITVEAVLHPYRQPQRVIRMSVRLPDTLTPGPVRLLVSGGKTLDHTLHLIPNPKEPPLNLAQTVAGLNRLHPSNRLYVTLLAPAPQVSLPGRSLPAVPLTIANVLEPAEERAGWKIDGETAIPLASKPLDFELSGSQVLTLTVRP